VNIEALIGKNDLIHTSDWVEPPSKTPKVTTVHDLIPFRYPEYSHPRIVSTHRKRLAWVIKESIKIICVSQSTRQDLIDSFGIDGKRTAVVYEGVDSTFQPASPDEITQIKKKYKINSDYIFCLSTIEPRKNIPRLIQAMKTVRKKYPEIKLVIGGRIGWTSPSPFGPGVITTGYLVDTDLPPLFSGCSCYVLPSLYEGFSLSHLQAMACGASVVGSRLSSMPEVIGDAGVLIDPFDVKSIATGIIEAIENRQSYSSLGLVRSKMFSWDKTAQQTHAIYQSVLST